MDDEHIRNMLASPLYLQEREASADLSQVYHSTEESLLPNSQSISTGTEKTLCIDVTEEKIPSGIKQRQNQDASWRSKRTITLWSKIQNCEARVQNWTRWHELNRQTETQCVEIDHTTTGYSESRREQALLHEELTVREKDTSWNSYLRYWWNGIIEESSRITSRWVFEKKIDRKPRHHQCSRQEHRNCKMKSIVWMILGIFKMSESASQWTLYPTFPDNHRYCQKFGGELEGMLSRDQSLRPDIWNPHGISGNVFTGLSASASTPFAGMLNYWDSDVAGKHPRCELARGKSVAESGEQNRDTILAPRFLRRPSAKNTFNSMEGRSLKNYVVDQQRLPISELHFDKFRTPSSFSWVEDKIHNWGVFLFLFPHGNNAMYQRSGDGWFSGRSEIFVFHSRVHSFPRFRVARREDCICPEYDHPEFYDKKKVSLEEQKAQKEDRLLRGRQIAYLTYDYFRITDVDETVCEFADLFAVALRNDDIQEFYTRRDDILLSMTKFAPDDILERLYKIRIRDSDQLRTALKLQSGDSSKKRSLIVRDWRQW